MESRDIVEKLKKNKVIKAIPELNNMVKALDKALKREDIIASQWAEVATLQADGVEYNEALKMAGL